MSKTRKKGARTPKRINATKSPMIARKRTKSQAQRSVNKNIKTFLYESPLKHLHHNGEQSDAQIQSDDAAIKEHENLPEQNENKIEINLTSETEYESVVNNGEQVTDSSTSGLIETKRGDDPSFSTKSNVSIPAKKMRAGKKSRLSTIADESVICVDDLETDSANEENTKTQVKSDDIVLIDDSFILSSSDTCHPKVLETANIDQNLMDSIIVLDDEPQTSTNNTVSRPTEDCMVVWSSLPQIPTTLTSSKYTTNTDILKADKILLDTDGEPSNSRCFRNDNNNKKLAKRSPKVTKFGVKKLTPKKVSEITKGLVKTKIVTKTVPKAPKTPPKRKKSKGELIFSAQNSESKDQKKSEDTKPKKGTLREIVIDGSNVAMAYTNNKAFSEKGIKMLIDYFTKKGHTVKVFIPQYRRSRHHLLLEKWYEQGIVVFTPSRKLGNKSITSYDDRYILEYAIACKGIIVSQDQFRDLYAEKVEYRETIEKRLLIPTFVGDFVMFPEDPLGRNGPALAEFLKH